LNNFLDTLTVQLEIVSSWMGNIALWCTSVTGCWGGRFNPNFLCS